MKHAIRALGWATAVFWILVILFSVTVVYSAMQIRMNRVEEEPEVTYSNGAITMSIPFSISNGGLYDISELNITTHVVAENETVSRTTTQVPTISRGDTANETYDISVSLDHILANLTYMLFIDTDLEVEISVALTYAHAIPLKISYNETLQWGAPFYNLSINIPPVSPQPANASVSFENHAFFGLNGTIGLQIMDSSGELIGSGTTDRFYVPPRAPSTSLQVTIIGDLGDMAEVHLYFYTSVFSFGPVVMSFD